MDIRDRADCERLVRAFYGRALRIRSSASSSSTSPSSTSRRTSRGSPRSGRRSCSARTPTAAARSARTPAAHEGAAAPRPLRALARALAHDRRRALRGRARRARQGARRARRRGVPRATRVDSVAGRARGGCRRALVTHATGRRTSSIRLTATFRPPGVSQLMSTCGPPRISALLAALALFASAPAALASHGEPAFFEAPGDLLGVPAAHQARVLAQLASLGVRALRVTLYWRDVAPHPDRRRRPSFDQANPSAYDWARLRHADRGGRGDALEGAADGAGPVPNWATPHGEDRYSYPSDADFRQFMARGRPSLRRAGEAVLDLERAQPAGVPAPAVRRQPARLAGDLPRPVPRRLRGTAGAGDPGKPVLMGETAAVAARPARRAAGLPARHAVPERELQAASGPAPRLPADGYAHHAYANSRGPFDDPPPTT